MITAVDIGNTNIKFGFFDKAGCLSSSLTVSADTACSHAVEKFRSILKLDSETVTWKIAPTGCFSWQKLQSEIKKIRPNDQFTILTHCHIPLTIDTDFPERVGIDRLLAAYGATIEYGDLPMLLVDAGSAVTVDVVQNRTFYGGAILTGFHAKAAAYPKISERLPLLTDLQLFVSEPVFPGKNTEEAIRNGLYWETIGAVRQFYEMFAPQKNVDLIFTGGDAPYLIASLSRFISTDRLKHNAQLVLHGIYHTVTNGK